MSGATWTVPNVLTGLRLLVVPFVGAVLLSAGDSQRGRWVALALFAVASVTDVADGWIARRWNQCTAFGALVDPIADKALVATALVGLSVLGIVPWWATAVILGREAAVTVLRMAVLHHGVIPASRGGKVKTVAQTVLIVLALAASQWTALLSAMIAGTVVWTVVTGLDYGVKAGALTRARAVPVPASPAAPRQLHS